MLGYCTDCGGWLGSSQYKSDRKPELLISRRDEYMTAAIEQMVSQTPVAHAIATHDRFTERVELYCQALTGGNLKAFEARLGFKKHVISNWRSKGCRPRIDLFLELCYRLKTTPVGFLTEEILHGWAETVPTHAREPVQSKRGDSDPGTLKSIRSGLESILNGSDAPTQLAAAEMLGVKRRYLNYRFPELAKAISEKHKAHRAQIVAKKRGDRISKAKKVVAIMMEKRQPISRRQIGRALEPEGLSLVDPDVRQAVKAAIKAIQQEWPNEREINRGEWGANDKPPRQGSESTPCDLASESLGKPVDKY